MCRECLFLPYRISKKNADALIALAFPPYRIRQKNADALIALANEQKNADAILQCASRVRMQLFIYCIAHCARQGPFKTAAMCTLQSYYKLQLYKVNPYTRPL